MLLHTQLCVYSALGNITWKKVGMLLFLCRTWDCGGLPPLWAVMRITKILKKDDNDNDKMTIKINRQNFPR